MATETQVENLKINKLTKAQYATITPSATELYFVTDDSGITSSDVTTALGYTPNKTVTETNTALTVSGGLCTWTISQTLGTNVTVNVYRVSNGEKIIPNNITITSSACEIQFLSTSNIAANTYRAVIQG